MRRSPLGFSKAWESSMSDPSLSQIRAATALVIVGTFLTGAIAGAGVYHWVSPRHHHRPPMAIPLEELGLSAEQDRRAHEIIYRRRAEIQAVMKDAFPRMRAIHEQEEKEVRALLDPEQQKKLDDANARHARERWHHGFEPPFGRRPEGPASANHPSGPADDSNH